MSAYTGAHRPNFSFRDFLQRPSLGQHFHPGEGPPRPGRGPLPRIHDRPLHEMPPGGSGTRLKLYGHVGEEVGTRDAKPTRKRCSTQDHLKDYTTGTNGRSGP